MKITNSAILMMMLSLLLTLTGCQDTTSQPGSNSTENSSFYEEEMENNRTVPLDEQHPDHINTDYDYDIMGNTLVVKLDSNQTTGGSWTAADMVNLTETDSFYTEDASSANTSGTSGMETHALTATQAGIGTVRLIYGQPWEGGSTFEVYNVTMTIDDDLNIADVQFEKEDTEGKN